MTIRAKYFIIAVIIIGSIGVWLPIGLEALIERKVTFHNVPSNVITYFVSCYLRASIDYFLGKFDN